MTEEQAAKLAAMKLGANVCGYCLDFVIDPIPWRMRCCRLIVPCCHACILLLPNKRSCFECSLV